MSLYCSPEYQTSDPWGRTIFYLMDVIRTSHFHTSNKVLSQLAFRFRRRFQTDGTILDFQTAFNYFFNLQVTLILPIKFQDNNWPYSSGGIFQNKFSRWPPWWPPWILDHNNFSCFWFTSHPDTFYLLAFWYRRKNSKSIFKMVTMVTILDFWSDLLLIYKSPPYF